MIKCTMLDCIEKCYALAVPLQSARLGKNNRKNERAAVINAVIIL